MNIKEQRAESLAKAQSIAEACAEAGIPLAGNDLRKFDGHIADAERLAVAIQADSARESFRSVLGPRVQTVNGASWLQRELRFLTPTTGSGTAIDRNRDADFALQTLSLESVFLRSGVNQIILGDGEGQALDIPTITADPTTYNIGAGTAITASDPTVSTTTATPQKFAALTTITNEVLNDANPAVLNTVSLSLVKSVATAFDLAALTGSGTAPAIAGLQTSAGGTVSMGTNGASLTNFDPFADAIGTVIAAGAEPTAIVVGVRTWKALLKIKTLTSTSNTPAILSGGSQAGVAGAAPLQIYGLPVYISGTLPINETAGTATTAQSAYVYSARDIHAVFRRSRRAASSLVSVEQDASAKFAEDSTQIRAVLRAAVAVPYAGAVCRITGILA